MHPLPPFCMMHRFLLSLSTGTILFGLSTLPGFAQEAVSSVRVSVTECRTLPRPQGFSVQLARTHDEWHMKRDSQSSTSIDAWITAHNLFHEEWQDRRLTYTRQFVACDNLMENTSRASARARTGVGFLPPRLPNTGNRTVLSPPARADVSWRDERYTGVDRPTRRTRVQEIIEMQESGERF